MDSFRRRCEEILFSRSKDEYSRRLFEFAEHYGFGTIAALVVVEHSPTLTEFSYFSNMPAGYQDFFEEAGSAQQDPVMQFCKNSSELIVWNADTYYSSGFGHFWDFQASFGLASGIAQAIHLERGRHFMLGGECDRFLRPGAGNLKTTVADFRTFITYAQAAAFELHLQVPADRTDPRLSKHDLRMLNMVMSGKTVSEIANALHLTEPMVRLRQERVTRKLGCSTKYEAVLKAIRLGYISC